MQGTAGSCGAGRHRVPAQGSLYVALQADVVRVVARERSAQEVVVDHRRAVMRVVAGGALDPALPDDSTRRDVAGPVVVEETNAERLGVGLPAACHRGGAARDAIVGALLGWVVGRFAIDKMGTKSAEASPYIQFSFSL